MELWTVIIVILVPIYAFLIYRLMKQKVPKPKKPVRVEAKGIDKVSKRSRIERVIGWLLLPITINFVLNFYFGLSDSLLTGLGLVLVFVLAVFSGYGFIYLGLGKSLWPK